MSKRAGRARAVLGVVTGVVEDRPLTKLDVMKSKAGLHADCTGFTRQTDTKLSTLDVRIDIKAATLDAKINSRSVTLDASIANVKVQWCSTTARPSA